VAELGGIFGTADDLLTVSAFDNSCSVECIAEIRCTMEMVSGRKEGL